MYFLKSHRFVNKSNFFCLKFIKKERRHLRENALFFFIMRNTVLWKCSNTTSHLPERWIMNADLSHNNYSICWSMIIYHPYYFFSQRFIQCKLNCNLTIEQSNNCVKFTFLTNKFIYIHHYRAYLTTATITIYSGVISFISIVLMFLRNHINFKCICSSCEKAHIYNVSCIVSFLCKI